MTITIDGDGSMGLLYNATEAGLRDAIAEYAHAFGWTVETERVIPNWGRLDLVLRVPGEVLQVAVELKLDLSQPARARRAFQQADGYHKWLTSQTNHRVMVLLVAPDVSPSHIEAIDMLYPDVLCADASWLLSFIRTEPTTLLGRQSFLIERLSLARGAVDNFASAMGIVRRMVADADAAAEMAEELADAETTSHPHAT